MSEPIGAFPPDSPEATHARTLVRLLERALANPVVDGFVYHVVVVPDVGKPTYQQCADAAAAAEWLRPYYDGDAHCFCVYGHACGLTKRPVYLVTPEGKFPLFDVADTDDPELAVVGYLGRPGEPAAPAPAPGAEAPVADEEPGDDDGEEEDDEDDDQ